jgi:hypothetical protein
MARRQPSPSVIDDGLDGESFFLNGEMLKQGFFQWRTLGYGKHRLTRELVVAMSVSALLSLLTFRHFEGKDDVVRYR